MIAGLSPLGVGAADGQRSQPSQPRIGVIGCGYWGPQVVRNLRDTSQAHLVAVAEPRPERQELVRMLAPGVPIVEDHRQLLEADLEGVVIATPIHTHFTIARDALAAGKHVLIEKPMTASVEEAVELIAMAAQRSLTLMVGHTFLYNPAVCELRRIVQAAELGRIHHIDAARLNLGLLQPNNNVIWDLAPHDVSILVDILGQTPRMVSARGSAIMQTEVHDVAYVELLFEGGLAAQVHVSWLHPAKVRRLTMVGDRKMAVYDDVSQIEKLRIYDRGVQLSADGQPPLYRDGAVVIPPIVWREPLLVQCEHFAHCVRSGEKPLSDGQQGLAVVAVLEAADRSLHAGGERVPVVLPLPVELTPVAAADGRGLRLQAGPPPARPDSARLRRLPASLSG